MADKRGWDLDFMRWLKSEQPPEPPYRKAVSRKHAADGVGEDIELECGHHIRLVHHHTASFPCAECLELSKPAAGTGGA